MEAIHKCETSGFVYCFPGYFLLSFTLNHVVMVQHDAHVLSNHYVLFPLSSHPLQTLDSCPYLQLSFLVQSDTKADIIHYQIQVRWKFPLSCLKFILLRLRKILIHLFWFLTTIHAVIVPGILSLPLLKAFCQWLCFQCYWEDEATKCDSLGYTCSILPFFASAVPALPAT